MSKTKVLHISYSDVRGGAALAAYRTHQMFLKYGHSSQMLVVEKMSDDPTVSKHIYQPNYQRVKLKVLSKIISVFSGCVASIQGNARFNGLMYETKYDAIFVHWTGRIQVPLDRLNLITRKIIFVSHDEFNFDGFRHYNLQTVSVMPAFLRRLFSPFVLYIERKLLRDKLAYYRSYNCSFVFPSRWLSERAKDRLYPLPDFKSCVIPYPADFKLPSDYSGNQIIFQRNKSVCFGAVAADNDPRKGFDLFCAAIKRSMELGGIIQTVELFGINNHNSAIAELKSMVPNVIVHGVLENTEVLKTFSRSELVVLPSLADNLPLACMEALSFGTPVISFNVGGFSDMITHGLNGYLCEPFNVNIMASKINDILILSDDDYQSMRSITKNMAEEFFEPSKIMQTYLNFFDKIGTGTS